MQIATSAVGRRHPRLRGAVAAALLAALCAAPTAASGPVAPSSEGLLAVSTFQLGSTEVTSVSVQSAEAVAKVSVVVPQGYALDLGRPAGSSLGLVSVLAADPGGGFNGFADGDRPR